MAEITEEKTTTEELLKKKVLDAYAKNIKEMTNLSSSRQTANDYFLGAPRSDDVKGRSKVISRDVFEIILWQLTDFVRIFLSGTQVVECRPQEGRDADISELLEDKINFDMLKLNKGFKILYQFAFDAFLNKVGVVKYWWKRYYEYRFHKYPSVSASYVRDMMNARVGGLDNINEVKEKHIFDKIEKVSDEVVDPLTGAVIQEAVYNVQCRERVRMSHPVAVNIPPEEFIYDVRMKDIEDTEYVIIHRMKIHKRSVSKYGFDQEDIEGEIKRFSEADAEIQSRFSDIGGINFITDDKDSDYVYVNECHIYDFDEEGNPIPKILFLIGNTVGKIEDNEYGRPNFAVITPFMLAHRMTGLSSYDMSSDIQDVQTAFLRMILDNGYYQNNGVQIVNQYRVNLAPLAEGKKPGMKLTMKYDVSPNDCIADIKSPELPASITNTYTKIMPMVKGARTGITPLTQGLDTKSIINRTSGGVSQHVSSAQGPRELIFRTFAETGIKDLFQGFVDMNLKFFDMEQAIEVNGNWINIDPRKLEGRGKIDVSIDVGIGTGTKREQFNNIMMMFDRYGGMAKILGPAMVRVAGLEELKNMVRKSWQLIGFKNTDEFVLPKANKIMGGGIVGNQPGNPTGLDQ